MTTCPRCRATNPPTHRFCEICGGPLGTASPSPPAHSTTPLREVRIGRDPSNHIVIPWGNQQVSRVHALVVASASGLTIQDLGSANGTFVDGRPATRPTPFTLRQEVRFGSHLWNTAELLSYLDRGGGQGFPAGRPTFDEQVGPYSLGGGSYAPPPPPMLEAEPAAVRPATVSPPSPPRDPQPTPPAPVLQQRRRTTAQVVHAHAVAAPAQNLYQCPGCGSDRIHKVNAGPRQKQQGCGCVGIMVGLIFIAIFFWVILAVLAAGTVLLIAYWPYALGGGVVWLLLTAVVAAHRARLWYCERCGVEFTRR